MTGATQDDPRHNESNTSVSSNTTQEKQLSDDHAEEDTFHDAETTQEEPITLETQMNSHKKVPQLKTDGIAGAGNVEPTTPVAEGSALDSITTPSATPVKDVVSPTSPVAKDLMTQIASSPTHTRHGSKKSISLPFSEFSHQQLATQTEAPVEEADEGEWQSMPALATHTVYDDWGKVIAKSYDDVEDESYGYGGLGGVGKGYTKVQLDDDVASQNSFDDNTAYLFKDGYAKNALDEDDEEARDILSQMQTTKELLTEGQRIAYVGVVRLSMIRMLETLEKIERTKGSKKMIDITAESMRLWSQKMMVRVYSHMDVDSKEQVMVEQLAEHGVLPEDLTPALMLNARVKNPKPLHEHEDEPTVGGQASEGVPGETQDQNDSASQLPSPTMTFSPDEPKMSFEPMTPEETRPALQDETSSSAEESTETKAETNSKPAFPVSSPTTPPPEYSETKADNLRVERPEDLPDTKSIDLDIRWTVLCDLFLLLIADGQYDARSRVLVEMVGKALAIEWQEICRFEKRVTDALEMQEQASKETWNEDENLESRAKAARKRRMVVMGLCTVGGGLVIGLSAGLLAPVIGAGLAAGFTSIGVAGTSSFFAGAGAATLIGTTGAGIGARIGINASDRRTGAVKTFEYRPLHNNKRVNLIVTVAGWMTGEVDDVRLPFSTVDPVMGDIYSVHWEPEMLKSTGQTIQILATEALTQTIQQVLGYTALGALMAGLSAPLILSKLAYLIDNPWTVSLARADAAGLILADSLIDRNLGARPITLVGFSLGARLIFSCLRELVKRGAIGLIQNVYLFGAPIVTNKDEWLRARAIVSGRLVNGFASHDWILSYLFRATSGGLRAISGLSKVDVPGVENFDISEIVPGHMAYRGMMPVLLAEVGWEIESLEFTEIEDPDPDNHERRQRQLISDIEEARRQLDEEPKKKGFFSRFGRKKATKKEWETYDEKALRIDDEQDPETIVNQNSNVLFDVEAIRREALELAKQGEPIEEITAHLQIREVKTTLPPMRISSVTLAQTPADKDGIRQTRSHDEPSRSFSMPQSLPPSNLSQANKSATELDTPKPVDEASTLSSRPALRSTTTAPNLTSSSEPSFKPDVKKNAWDDEEDADFGKERDVEMSFE